MEEIVHAADTGKACQGRSGRSQQGGKIGELVSTLDTRALDVLIQLTSWDHVIQSNKK